MQTEKNLGKAVDDADRECFVDIVRRPLRLPPKATVPLVARSIGHARFSPRAIECASRVNYSKVMWAVENTGTVKFADREHVLAPGYMVVYAPHTFQFAQAHDAPWELRWFTWEGPLAVEIGMAFGFKRAGIYKSEVPPVKILDQIRDAIRMGTKEDEIKASVMAYDLLAHVSRRPQGLPDDPLIREMVVLIEKEWSSPTFGIKTLARHFQMHRSTLTRRFQASMGIAPSDYLLNMRLQRAMMLLKQTDQPIREIGRLCGYSDPAYFARLFRNFQKETPRQFRKTSFYS